MRKMAFDTMLYIDDGGHYNLDTLQCFRAVLKEGSAPCIMFKIQVAPSLKINCYWSILVFEAASH
jgi:hypothetical protein